MDQPLDITQVVRRTGLTARALRFYEGRGLVAPLRTASGRRLYGAGELHRLNQLVALKAAGFSLTDIAALLGRGPVDLGRMLAAQLQALDAEAARVAEARALILTAKSRVDRGEPLDAATLCSLIRTGDRMMDQEKWKAVTDRYVDPAHRSEWAEAHTKMPAGFDQAAYSAKWEDLGRRIEAALPLEPRSEAGQAFLAEWRALLAPFAAVATPGMQRDVGRLYDNIGEWEGEQTPPFSAAVWRFVTEAGRCG